jgi:uncharacterized protein YgiM (DUF1202 family)
MKARILVIGLILGAVATAHAGSLVYVQCGTYDSYILIYKTTERFEELGKLRCSEKVELLSRSGGYAQIRTLDGRLGWVRDADLSDTPPPPQRIFTFGLTEQAHDVQSSPAPTRLVSPLTNEDILAMHANHPGSDLIVKKIKSSRCAFDTSPAAFQTLRASGLSDKVILAMLAAPIVSETTERRPPENVEVRILDGTSIEVQLNGSVSSEELQDGTIVEMSAAEDLVVNGVPVILRGSPARARIMAIKPPGSHGASGEVAWFMQDIVAISGDRIPVTFAPKQPGDIRTGIFAGYPFLVSKFHKGDPAIKATDKRFRVVIHGDTVLSVSQSLTAGLPVPKPRTQSVRQVSTQQTVQPESAPSPQPSPSDEVKP